MNLSKPLIAAGLSLTLVLLAKLVQAAPIDERRVELRSLRDQIRSLEQELVRSEESRGEAADELAQSEKAISESQRKLREIARARQRAEAEVRRLQAEQAELESRLDVLRRELGDAVFRVYVEGGQAGARRILSGGDANQLARDAYYLEQIARQRSLMIDEARLALENLEKIKTEAEARQVELRRLELERTREQKQLAEERRKHLQAVEGAAGKLKAQQREMKSLQADALRMEKLLKGLERISKAQRQSAARAASAASAPSAKPTAPGTASEPLIRRADKLASNEDSGLSLLSLRGRLRWPVKGELSGRFGGQRAEGGAQWKGVFIRSASGTEVHAIADGKIAYADWLRGFGNLIIVDHGNEYLSIYGNNDALFRSPGDSVKAGEVIASVGATGGADESGLYFELRYRGQAIDPAKWMASGSTGR